MGNPYLNGMEKPQSRKVNPATSEELTGIKVTAPANYAAGALGVKVAMEHAIGEMGAIRAFQTLAKLNQKNGFDCPGCAWPDPDDSRTPMAEYCENGVKAITEEATKRRANPDFFARHSIDQLGGMTDFELGKSGRITHPMYLAPGASV